MLMYTTGRSAKQENAIKRFSLMYIYIISIFDKAISRE